MKTIYFAGVAGILTFGALIGGCRGTERITRASELKRPSDGTTLRVLMKDSSIYLLTNYLLKDTVLLGTGQITSVTPRREFSGRLNLHDVAYIEARYSSLLVDLAKYGIGLFVVGTAVAYAGDMGAGASVNAATERITYSTSTGGGTGSCPHVYTIDAAGEHFESETFAGAVFKGAEHPAFDVLTHATAVGGVLKLRIVNESYETEYTNEMKLLAVDAPSGVFIVPDSKGAMHTIAGRTPPTACEDFAGQDKLGQVRALDGQFWHSDVEKKDFTKPSDLHDGLILTIPKPAHARVAKLVVSGVNTKLGMFSLEQLFRLRGENKLRWYQQLENNRAERMRFIKLMMRDGMLHAKVWRNDQWIEQGAFMDVGPYKVKRQIVLIDVSQLDEPQVRVKLEATTDLWKVDEIFVDYSDDQNVTVTEIRPAQVITERGIDVAGPLSESDDEYYTSLFGEHAVASFGLPVQRERTNRSYVLKTQGYYYQWFDSHGEDHPEEIERILDQPLYGSAKILPLWKERKSTYH